MHLFHIQLCWKILLTRWTTVCIMTGSIQVNVLMCSLTTYLMAAFSYELRAPPQFSGHSPSRTWQCCRGIFFMSKRTIMFYLHTAASCEVFCRPADWPSLPPSLWNRTTGSRLFLSRSCDVLHRTGNCNGHTLMSQYDSAVPHRFDRW